MMPAETKNEFDVRRPDRRLQAQDGATRERLKRAYDDVRGFVMRAAEKIRSDNAAGRADRAGTRLRGHQGRQESPTRRRTRSARAAVAIVRGVFPASQAGEWFDEVGRYLEENEYERKEVEKRSLDKYFSALKAGKPQIFNRLLVEAAGAGATGREACRDALLPRPAVDQLRGRLRSRPPVHVCRPRPPPAARRQDARPLAAHGCRHGRALDRSRLPARLREGLRRRLARL